VICCLICNQIYEDTPLQYMEFRCIGFRF
jgi:hypothetical protein